MDSDGQEPGWAKHQCSEDKSAQVLQSCEAEVKKDNGTHKTVGASAVMGFPCVSMGKRVTMAAEDFKSLMDFVKYIK